MQRLYGYEGAVQKLAEIGFDAYDFTLFDMTEQPNDPMTRPDYKETCFKLRKAADKAGIICNQSHAPFPSYRAGDEKYNGTIQWHFIRALEVTSLLGGEICIIHPCNDWSAEDNAEKIFRPLEPYAKKFGVKIALENMWNYAGGNPYAVPCACSTAEDFLRHLNLLDPEHFVACLDIGHAEMLGDCVSAPELIRALGPRLKCLHVHDNDKVHDLHTFPFLGDVKWEPIYAALRETGYDGDFTFEALVGNFKYPPELLLDSMKLLHATGRYMISKIEE